MIEDKKEYDLKMQEFAQLLDIRADRIRVCVYNLEKSIDTCMNNKSPRDSSPDVAQHISHIMVEQGLRRCLVPGSTASAILRNSVTHGCVFNMYIRKSLLS
jgi:hypothetical protein